MDENNEAIIIGGTVIEGKVSGDANVRIEGTLRGSVDIKQTLVVAAKGCTEADIKASVVVIEGHHRGDVQASDMIQITPSAKAVANLKAPAIAIEKGAKFCGNIEMSGE